MEIATGIFQDEIQLLKGRVEVLPDLEYSELQKLTEYSPRQQKQQLRIAIARAVQEGRNTLEITAKSSTKSFRMGFL
jgi:hypothetical protein